MAEPKRQRGPNATTATSAQVYLHQLYFCCRPLSCCAGNMYPLPGLMAFTDGQNVTFGSDFPFAPNGSTKLTVNSLNDFFAADPMTLWRIRRGNTLNLIPKAPTPAYS